MTADLIGNEIADTITSVSKTSQNASKKLCSKADENETEIPIEGYIPQEKRK